MVSRLMLMLNSKVVFYQNMTEVPQIQHLHTHIVRAGTVLHKCDQFADICRTCSTTDHAWPRGSPIMGFSAKCAFTICLGIGRSTERNFESEEIFMRNRRPPYWNYTSIFRVWPIRRSGVEFPTFPFICIVVLETLWHYPASVGWN